MRALTEEELDLLFDERLFNDWRKAHEDEAGQKDAWLDQYLSTFPDLKKSGRQDIDYRNDFYSSFCRDGFLTTPQSGQRTLLFICREANLGKDKIVDQKLIPEQGRFWMREQFRNPEGNKKDRYYKFIQEIVKEYHEPLNLAYMNLNKRGGFGCCNMARVGHYVARYQRFIQAEIELISPDIIICGGTYDTVIKYFPAFRNKCKNYYHPCYRIEEKMSKASV